MENKNTDEVAVYFRLYLLLYADDTVILAKSAAELQASLNAMYLYCQTWKLQVNISKTKVVIFSRSRRCTRCAFTSLKESLLENIIPRY
jgi:hypothetical protein